MWKPTNQPQTPAQPSVPERPTTSTPSAPAMSAAEPVAPRPVTTTTADQALINSCAGGDANSCAMVVTGLQQECSQGLAVSCNMLNVLFPFG